MILNGDQLLLEDYGSASTMLYGKKSYIQAQQMCLWIYENLPQSEEIRFCKICFEPIPSCVHLTTRSKKTQHEFKCKPYLTKFFIPQESGKVPEIERY